MLSITGTFILYHLWQFYDIKSKKELPKIWGWYIAPEEACVVIIWGCEVICFSWFAFETWVGELTLTEEEYIGLAIKFWVGKP